MGICGYNRAMQKEWGRGRRRNEESVIEVGVEKKEET